VLDHRRNRSAAAVKPSIGAAGSALAAAYHQIMRLDPYRAYKGRPAAKPAAQPAVKSAPPKPAPPPAEPLEPAKEAGGEKPAGK
jgi:hypothetical protein